MYNFKNNINKINIVILSFLPFFSFLFGYYFVDIIFFKNKIEVPNVVGLYIHDAINTLSKYKLNTRILNEKEDIDMPEGIILDQNPRANSIVKSYQSIFLTVTRKPNPVYAPNFYGNNISNLEKIVKKNIEIKKYPIEYGDIQNIVIAQNIEPNFEVNENITIYYSLNITKKLYIMPSFYNLDLEDVKEFLSLNNLKYKIEYLKEDYNKDYNYIIIDQKPSEGSIIDLEKIKNIKLIAIKKENN